MTTFLKDKKELEQHIQNILDADLFFTNWLFLHKTNDGHLIDPDSGESFSDEFKAGKGVELTFHFLNTNDFIE